MLCSGTVLSTHPVYNGLCLLTPNPMPSPVSSPHWQPHVRTPFLCVCFCFIPRLLSSLAATRLYSISVRLLLLQREVRLCHTLDFTCKWNRTVFVFV